MKKHFRVPLAALSFLGAAVSFNTVALAADSGTSTTSAGTIAASSTSTMNSGTVKAAITQQQAIDTAAKLLTIPDSFKENNVQLQQNWAQYTQPVYSISWQGPAISGIGGMGNRFPAFINVVVDANTGDILSYNGNIGGANWYDASTATQSQARQVAQHWVDRLAPLDSNQMVLDNTDTQGLFPGNSFVFRFVRTVNGVPAPFDGAQVTLGPNGDLVGYQFSWHDVTFPNVAGQSASSFPVSLDTADTTYQHALGLHLQYTPPYNGAGNQMGLYYVPNQSFVSRTGAFNTAGPWIDPATGAVLGQDGEAVQTQSLPNAFTPLVPGGPDQPPGTLQTPLDQSSAEALVRKMLDIGPDVKLTSVSQGGYSAPGGISGSSWSLTFQPASGGSPFQVTVDANTGSIQNYNQFSPHPGAPGISNSITDQKAQQIASDFVKQLYPTLTGAIAPDPFAPKSYNTNGNVGYSENFSLLINGIPVSNDINIQVDGAGKVQNMFAQPWALQMKYPSASGVIPVSQAENAFVKKAPLQLAYELPVKQSQSQPGQSGFQYADKAILVYAPDWGNSGEDLDAETGQWTVPWIASGSIPTDITNHVGASEMVILAQHGTLPVTDGKANPDQVVTRAEFVSWLVKATGEYLGNADNASQSFSDVPPTNPYYSDLQQAVTQGWLSAGGAFNPYQPITRADAANIIVHWLGWSKLAAESDLFADGFKDGNLIPKAELGDAVIANAFGIIPAVNGSFLANNNMTVADAAIAIVHAFRTAYDQSNNS